MENDKQKILDDLDKLAGHFANPPPECYDDWDLNDDAICIVYNAIDYINMLEDLLARYRAKEEENED